MLLSSTLRISELLSEPGLLPPEQIHELQNVIFPQCRDWNILLPELVFRKWLTPFQASMIASGRGRDLRLGSYILKDRIGNGETDRVFRAEHAKLRTPVVVKILLRSQLKNPATRTRFLREIRALASLRHPNIVHALDADISGERIYCVMEYVPGLNLGQLIQRQGILPWETAVRLTLQLAQALQYIAAAGLIHRDIKPENIQITQDGQTVKLLDLGLARFERFDLDDADGGITRTGMIIGTPNYMAPEQIRDAHSADIRSDLYGLGCTLYHMVTGQPPFESPDIATALKRQLGEDAVPAESFRPDLPPVLAGVIRTLMQKKPRDRFQHPGELIDALRPLTIPEGDTLNESASITCTGLPDYQPDEASTVRTDEVPVSQLLLVDHESGAEKIVTGRPRDRRGWMLAVLVVALTLVAVILSV